MTDPLESTSPLARASDPDTSHRAPRKWALRADRKLVLFAHFDHPQGLTDFELAEKLSRQQNSVGKRRFELWENGLVEATAFRRLTPTKSSSIVWKINSFGIQTAQELKQKEAENGHL